MLFTKTVWLTCNKIPQILPVDQKLIVHRCTTTQKQVDPGTREVIHLRYPKVSIPTRYTPNSTNHEKPICKS